MVGYSNIGTRLNPNYQNFGPDGKFEAYYTKLDEVNIITSQAGDSNFDRNIFFVDKPSDGTTGWNPKFRKYIFVHPDTISTYTTANGQKYNLNVKFVSGHELGHTFGVGHVNRSINPFPITINDTDNIMYSFNRNKLQSKFRKKQWDMYNLNFKKSSSGSKSQKYTNKFKEE